MRRTTTITATLAAAALTLAGCSSSDEGKPAKATATVTATKTPELSAEEQLKACVDAWAEVLDQDADSEATPAPCQGVPDEDQLDAYMDGLAQRNQANRDEIAECVDDPSCTSVPIP